MCPAIPPDPFNWHLVTLTVAQLTWGQFNLRNRMHETILPFPVSGVLRYIICSNAVWMADDAAP